MYSHKMSTQSVKKQYLMCFSGKGVNEKRCLKAPFIFNVIIVAHFPANYSCLHAKK
jgi:hypothetical protein